MKKALVRIIMAVFCPLLLYALTALVLGVVPVNRDFRQSAQGIDISIHANAVHTDLIVPVKSDARDWNTRLPNLAGAAYLAIGWGDRAFYLETKQWADLKADNALRALAGFDGTLLHVEPLGRPLESAEVVKLRISPAQYVKLVAAIDDSFALDAYGKPIVVAGAHYDERDAFYEATGRYSLFSTCNDWGRAALAQAGIRTAVWAPFAPALLYQARAAQTALP
ncbi:MAG TPA: TIGR02117 family protein [Burkholderiaceae bacterium]